jgi:hypothetical protein
MKEVENTIFQPRSSPWSQIKKETEAHGEIHEINPLCKIIIEESK